MNRQKWPRASYRFQALAQASALKTPHHVYYAPLSMTYVMVPSHDAHEAPGQWRLIDIVNVLPNRTTT